MVGPAQAQPSVLDQWDAQLWLQWNSQIPVSKTWNLLLEGQPRWNQNVNHFDQIVLRAGVARRVSPWLQLGAAYAFVPRHTVIGNLYEHQAYEQVVFTLPRVGKWAPQVRVREDQRYLSQWGELSHRVREQFRVTRPMPGAASWTLVLHQELFYNWDHTPLGPSPGIDQHRLFVGVQHPITRDIAIETGYMWQDVFRLGLRPERQNHIALFQFQYRPRRGAAAPPAAPVTPAGAGDAM
jgi:hypothetical protein